LGRGEADNRRPPESPLSRLAKIVPVLAGIDKVRVSSEMSGAVLSPADMFKPVFRLWFVSAAIL
jgi:hypothetical protein